MNGRCVTLSAMALMWLMPALAAEEVKTLPDTKPLKATADLSTENLKAVDRYLLQRVHQSTKTRQMHWKRNYSNPTAYRQSIQANRESLKRRIGMVDKHHSPHDLQLVASLRTPALVAGTATFRVLAVRWQVFDDVQAEGLLLEPAGKVKAHVIVVPDANWSPEMLAGIGESSKGKDWAKRLAQAGCRVLVPTIIDRQSIWSGNLRVRMLNQTHREFIYRQAFFMGRHLIGYEVQEILAGIEYFLANRGDPKVPIGVAGYGEGALLAFYSAAVEPRIDAALVSGYFGPREGIHQEPVYRNVYGLLHEFGDADIASLVAPRSLIIEACRAPHTPDPPPVKGRNTAASGRVVTPTLKAVRSEFDRARSHCRQLKAPDKIALVVNDDGDGPPGSDQALEKFANELGITDRLPPSQPPLKDRRSGFKQAQRMKRLFDQLVDHTQKVARNSRFRRTAFWAKADRSSLDQWQKTTRSYRDVLWDDVIGRLPEASLPPNARTRKIYDTPRWQGYEVVLDVYPGVFTYGILTVPKDLKPGEKRPVVVAQHGRNGRPQVICTPGEDTRAYHSYGAKLADLGYVVYAPQNLYIGEEHYRTAQRKAFALGMTIFAPMVRQHEQFLTWLKSLPFVDGKRIGFYGLSYGGKSAMLIPAVLEDYALSICSGDFNEEVWKHTSIEDRYSFMFTLEHEHTEFDFGDRFNYAEIAGLIAPRPFMVERGHRDGVAPDEWVAYEYARVRRLYVTLGIGNRTEIEFFNGRHEINGKGTFEFLGRHLKWKKK